MQKYTWFRLTKNTGNNAFTFNERKTDQKLWVAPLREGKPEDLAIGSETVFSEKDTNWEVQSYVGLKNFILSKYYNIPVYIFDNHNHALYFRYREHLLNHLEKGLALVHIDQHSDMNPNPHQLEDINLNTIFHFTQEQCNVGNFIIPALKTGFLSTITQIRSEYWLLHTQLPNYKYILDIDMDFWAPEMWISAQEVSFQKVRKLMQHASLITMATSPYFLDQSQAIQLITSLFDTSNN